MKGEIKDPGFGRTNEIHEADFESDLSDHAIITEEVLGPLECGDFQIAADNAFDCANAGITDDLLAQDRAHILEVIDACASRAQTAEDQEMLQRTRRYFTPRS